MSKLRIFDEWSTYEKVVANDYMLHRKFFASLMDQIETRLDQPLSIIDIGCGDAQPVLTLLERFQIERYIGIDQSETALDRARRALTATGVTFDLRDGSMLTELKGLDGAFDLVIGSYSLHHLDGEQKCSALIECRRLLRPQGMLAIIDVFMEEEDSRTSYVGRWEENARRSFKSLSPAEMEALLEHMRSSDIPETVSDYGLFGKSAGFGSMTVIRQDPELLNKLVLFY
jgi:ubiquinone/menaquinone biosynthesis C-methylase UbiE